LFLAFGFGNTLQSILAKFKEIDLKVKHMDLKEKIRNKFDELITSSAILKIGNAHRQIRNDQHSHDCKAWLASAQNLAHLVLGTSSNSYKTNIDKICSTDRGLRIHDSVGAVASILESLLSDIDNGLISSIENQTKAVVFDDFLDHAKEYAKKNLSKESGVISGVVFEDTLRTICRNNNIEEKGQKLDELISVLSKQEIFNEAKAKRARVAAHVRTKATHAQWDEFDISDVKTTIAFTEELITNNLC